MPATQQRSKVCVGDVVLWSGDPGGNPEAFSPAIVTKIIGNGINCTVFADGSRSPSPKDGVRHVGDPQLKTMIESSGGVWKHVHESDGLHEPALPASGGK